MTLTNRSRYWLPLLPLLLLLACVYWLDLQVQQEVMMADKKQRHDPDMIMNRFHATKMDKQGVPRGLMSAQELRHYPDHDTTELDAPHLTLLSSEHPPVYVESERGLISSRGDEVFFRESVVVQREARGEQSAVKVNSEYLRVVPDKDWADTDRPVKITNINNVIHAVGLEMDNKARTLKLLSQVRSEHQPHAK